MTNPGTQSQLPTFSAKPPAVYEFPKRKRWADLLVTELVDNIVFVLSPTCKIWYCGAAVTEILGWKPTELIDYDFLNLIDLTDQVRFTDAFHHAIQENIEFNLTIKLNCSENSESLPHMVLALRRPKSIIFDIKCYPYSSDEEPTETKCLIAMAVPSPGHNTAMLDTVLDLQARQSVLLHRVTELRQLVPPATPSSTQPPSSQSGSMYATSTLNSTKSLAPVHKSTDSMSNSYFSSSGLTKSLDGGMRGLGDSIDFSNGTLYDSHTTNVEDPGDDGSKKKKLKRAQNAEQYVCFTCGRTNSPEWRKGPQGPKTLCNACGLRWAKQMRKVEDPTDRTLATNLANT